MKIDLSHGGATVDAHDLGPLLGLDPSEVPAKMRAGEITSRSEQGIDEDAGRVRLTFWYKSQRVRLICDADGTVLKTTRINATS
ncbi:hypothetical protein SAMN05421665_2651 [Yoonia rosea]|uniref:Uncharacterized protein n=1 Tax=Yoonia rosea TaxID=287098 RepID=A0A1R3XAF4_9RHOB|nr:DUF6522 family protein [Yoonia rosea]SIT88216.1 hypothetical protein SAMN05421665_2651 [Yoonia rosea]